MEGNSKDAFEQDLFIGFWLTMFLKDIEATNFLIRNFESFKELEIFETHEDLEEYFEEIKDFGRKLNNTILESCIRKGEEMICKY